MSGKKTAVKSFLLSFSAAFLVLAVIATGVAMMVGKHTGPSLPQTSEELTDNYIQNEEDDLTALFIFHENPLTESTLCSYYLLHFDVGASRTLVTPLPYQTMVTYDGEKKTVDALWREKGGEAAGAAVSDALQVTVDAYFQMDLSGLEELISRAGTIKYDVEETATFTRDGRNVKISAGKQLLDGKKILDLGYYQLTARGEMQRNRFLAEVISLYIERRIAPLYLEDADKLYQNLLECTQTNLSAGAYVTRSGFFKSLFQKGGRATAVEIGGQYGAGHTQFYPSTTAISTLHGLFR